MHADVAVGKQRGFSFEERRIQDLFEGLNAEVLARLVCFFPVDGVVDVLS